MNIEVGKKYKDTNNRVVEIVNNIYDTTAKFPYVGILVSKYDTPHTYLYSQCGVCASSFAYDLIEEAIEEVIDMHFKTVPEVYAHLASGGIVRNKGGNTICYFNNDNLLIEYIDAREKGIKTKIANVPSFSTCDLENLEKYEKPLIPQWYDNIPEQGILCWTSDNAHIPSKEQLRIVLTRISQHGDRYWFMDINDINWDNAKPVTIQELSPYLLSEVGLK